MKELRIEIEVNASAERVWHVLTDFASFPQWNPFIRRASGEIKKGAKLEINVQPTGARGVNFRPTVLNVETNRELRLLARLWIPGLFDGEHILTIEQLGENRVRFVQRVIYRGILVPFFSRNLDKDIRRGLDEMNKALKVRAEHSEAQ